MNEYFPPSERLLAVTDSQKSDETAAEVTEVQASPESVDPESVDAAQSVEAAQPAQAAEPADAAQPEQAVEAEAGQEKPAPSPEPAAEPEAAQEKPAPSPRPTPAPRPAPTPAAFAARPKAGPAATVTPVQAPPATSLAEAARWGRVEGDGHVFLTIDGEEHPVGQYPDVSNDEALAYFARKYDDVVAQIVLLEQRVASKAPTTDMQKTVTHLREQLAERNMVGDIRSAEGRLDTLSTQITELEKAEKAQHDAVRAAELAAREAIVAEAEAISGTDPAQVQWKTSAEERRSAGPQQ